MSFIFRTCINRFILKNSLCTYYADGVPFINMQLRCLLDIMASNRLLSSGSYSNVIGLWILLRMALAFSSNNIGHN